MEVKLDVLNKQQGIAVCFSAGVDSTAVLLHAIDQVGKDNVVALTTSVSPQIISLHKAQNFYTSKICEMLEVKHHIIKSSFIPNSDKINFWGYHYWVYDALSYALGNRNSINRVWWGLNKDDEVHRFIVMHEKMFNYATEIHKVETKLIAPLRHLPKIEMYQRIPKKLLPFVWVCDFYKSKIANNDKTLKFVPCKKCKKCKEFDTLVLSKI